MADKIAVTRHPALVVYLREIGLIDDDTPVLSRVNDKSEVAGKHVIGTLPYHLACHAECLTEVPVITPLSKRGYDLSLAEVREYVRTPNRYRVAHIGTERADEISRRKAALA